jgi:multidrug resistance efflux pump
MHIAALMGLAAFLTVTIASAQQRATDEPAATAPEGRGIAVFNPVEGRITVLSSRPDGSRVEKGDVVCELDPADLNDRLDSGAIEVQAAQAGAQGARLSREAAEMELDEYKEGRFVQDMAAVGGEIKLAESDLMRGQSKLDWARRMYDKGFLSMAQKDSEEAAFKKAQFALEQAQSKKQELLNHTRSKMTRALMGAIESARERELRKQARSLRAQATLKKLRDQLGRCKVAAPVAGRVRYDAPMGTGAVVLDGQVLFRIVPDGAPGGGVR